ncbi:MAG: L-threonylcarbamoyladenylate synthase [Gammaproteobacteria bacterium]|nr:L-threonylcarbamoyladenylate synthase [Gammaproteobacteria bacterium]
MSPWRLRQIASAINQGAIIAYPTDTIWGFGCHPRIEKAVTRIKSLKRRPRDKGLILLASSIELFKTYINPDDYYRHLSTLKMPRPRPLTWIVRAHPDCPSWLKARRGTLAIRITDLSHIRILCQGMQAPLVSTSANLSGQPTARNQFNIHKQFQHDVDFVIEGYRVPGRQASEIRELDSGKILRA